jgi:hypothetical protein
MGISLHAEDKYPGYEEVVEESLSLRQGDEMIKMPLRNKRKRQACAQYWVFQSALFTEK